MYAIHSTLLPPSAIHHTLYLPHFTPSTIYPLPRPSTSTAQDIKVVGNLITGGSSDLRVFEIREELRPVVQAEYEDDGMAGDAAKGEGMVEGKEVGDSFFDNGPSQRAPLAYETHRTLHHLTTHQVHGTITGLAALRTIDSSIDGLDRLLVSFKDAKLAILEWSRGDIATVSLHTYERCPQMTTGDMSTYVPRLRTDPLSRIALLSLPDDGLAVLPIVQEQSDLDMVEAFPRDVPYTPSFVLALSDVSPAIKNLADLIFLSGYNSPTLALLYTPTQTWAGRYHSTKDTFILEIRTIDLSGGSYPLLTRVESLPSDTLYIVPCPKELGGVMLVTTTGLLHVDQSGRVVCASVNAWWGYTTDRPANRNNEHRKLSLEGSRASFVGDRDMLLVLASGRAHQARMEMDGRAVGSIIVEEEVGVLPPPSSISRLGADKVFVGSPEGDSVMYEIQMIREKVDQGEDRKPTIDMEVDYDDDLYADAAPIANGTSSGIVADVYTGPAKLQLNEVDRITGIGKIIDMDFGIAVTDQGARTYPQLVTIGGGSRNSTLNVLRRGIPINKRRRFNELSTAEGVWFLPIQRQSGVGAGQQHKFRNIPDELRTTLLLSSEGSQTRVFALSNKANPEQIGRLASTTVHAAPFFQRSSVFHVSPHSVDLLDGDGKHSQTLHTSEDSLIVSASISDPFAVIRREDGQAVMFVGDTIARTISQTAFIPDGEQPLVHAIEVFTDTTGIYRTFEQAQNGHRPNEANGTRNGPSHSSSSRQTAEQQIQRLQHDKPAISTGKPSVEEAIHTARGSQWLSLLTTTGELQIRSLPDLSLVFQSEGLAASNATFTDDLLEGGSSGMLEDPDEIKQMLFHPLGRDTLRPHLLVLHKSGRLNTYEAQPRYTLDTADLPRRSLAIRYRRVHTQVLSSTTGTKLVYKMHPFTDLEGYTGVFVTGEKPQWIIGSSTHPVRSFGLKQAAATFGRTTHLGGMGEYFMRIEDGTFICYLPPTLTTDFEMPCDRYEMDRVYTNISFDPPSGHYVGAAAITVPFQAYDEEGEIQLGPQGENLIPPTNERSTLELFSQGSDPWRVIDGYDFDQNEVVLCMQSVNLESPSSPTGFKDFIAVGTGFDFAEDRATRGNVSRLSEERIWLMRETYIFEIVETVGSTPKESGWRLKQRAKDPARNPVSALGNITGYMLNSNGPKLYVKGLDYDQRLMGLAFLDVNIYATSIRVFKNFVLVTDLLKSIWLVSLQDEPYKFTVISKDLREVHALTGDFLVQEGQVTFLITDRKGDMRMLDFDPADSESLNGERLILRTEFHMGAAVTVSKMIARRRTTDEESAPQSQLVYGTADGSLTTIVAVKPARFKRLQLVADQLTRNAQHTAGLNPKAFRTVQNDLLPKPLTRGILDGQLLSHFALQPVKRQREMMRQIGTDEVTVASDLQALGGFW